MACDQVLSYPFSSSFTFAVVHAAPRDDSAFRARAKFPFVESVELLGTLLSRREHFIYDRCRRGRQLHLLVVALVPRSFLSDDSNFFPRDFNRSSSFKERIVSFFFFFLFSRFPGINEKINGRSVDNSEKQRIISTNDRR